MWASCGVAIDQTHIYNHASVLDASMRAKHLVSGSGSAQEVTTWDREHEISDGRLELGIALPNRPHRETLRGWQGPYLAGFQRIAPIEEQTKYMPGHSYSHKART